MENENESLLPFVIEWWPLSDGVALWPDVDSEPARGGVKIQSGDVICIYRGICPDDDGAFTMVSGGIDDMERLHAILGEAIRRVRTNIAEDGE